VVENPVKLARAGLIEEVGQAGVEEPRGWGRTDREDERWTDASGAQGGATHKAERRTRSTRWIWTRVRWSAATLQGADQGDTKTWEQTLSEAGMAAKPKG